MLVFYSTTPVFWSLYQVFPTPAVLEQMRNRCRQTDQIKINWVNESTITINTKWKGNNEKIQWLWFRVDNFIYYYMYDATQSQWQDGGTLVFTLDWYSTYMSEYLTWLMLQGQHLRLLRCGMLDDEGWKLYNDPILEAVNKNGNWAFIRNVFPKSESATSTLWMYGDIGLKYTDPSDAVNATSYMVFSSGEHGKYQFFPLLSKYKPITVMSRKGANSITLKIRMKPGTTSPAINYPNNEFVVTREDTGQELDYNAANQLITQYGGLKKLKSSFGDIIVPPQERLFTDLRLYFTRWSRPGSGAHGHGTSGTDYTWKSGNNTLFTFKQKNGSGIPKESYETIYMIIENSASGSQDWYDYPSSNDSVTLTKMRESNEFSNKFVGWYLLPHMFYMKNYLKYSRVGWTNVPGSYLDYHMWYLELDPEGVLIPEYELLKKMDISLNNDYLYQFIDVKHYGNEVDIKQYLNPDQRANNFITSGYFNFTSRGTYVDKVDFLPLSRCIWNYPGQLPIGVDTYKQYIAATYNTANTSVAIAKQQMGLGIAKSIFSLGTSLIGAGSSPGETTVKKNILSTGIFGYPYASSSVSTSSFTPSPLATGQKMASTAANSAFGIIGNVINYKNKMMSLKAQYEDTRNVKGSLINESDVLDSSLISYYLSSGEQYSGNEIFLWSDETKKTMELYLNYFSYYYPKDRVIAQVINFDSNYGAKGIQYIQFDEDQLGIEYHIHLSKAFRNIPVVYANAIYQKLVEGFRLTNLLNPSVYGVESETSRKTHTENTEK